MNLNDLIVRSKTIEEEYPEISGFFVTIAYLTKDELRKLRKECITIKFSRNAVGVDEDVDLQKFQKKYVEAVIKDWRGLKYKHLNHFFPANISNVDPEDEIKYSTTNALFIMENSNDFDDWITAISSNLASFTKGE